MRNNHGKAVIIFIIVLILLAITGSVGAYVFFKSNVEEEYVTDENKIKFFDYLNKTNIESVLDINEYVEILKKTENTNNESTTSISVNTTENEWNGYDINKIGIEYSTKSNKSELLEFADIKLKYANNDILSIQEIKENNKLAIKSDEIVNKYVGVDIANFKTVLKKISPLTTVVIPDSFEDIKIGSLLYIDEELKDTTINKYKNIIYNEIQNNRFSIQEEIIVSVDGQNYTTTAYNVVFTENELKNISIKILSELKNDDSIVKTIVEKCHILEKSQVTEDIVRNEIQKKIDEIQTEEYTDNEKVKLTLYENENKIIKIRCDIYAYADIELDLISKENSNKAILTYLNKSDGKKNGINIIINRNDNNKLIIDVGIITNGAVSKKVSINNVMSGNSSSASISNNIEITYKEKEISTSIKLDNKISFNDVIIDKLTESNCLFLDTLSDEDLTLAKNTILEKIFTVYKEKKETLNIIKNNMQSTIISTPENVNQ